MITAAELSGFFVAHGIWSLAEGHSFDPMLAYVDHNGERCMERLVLNDRAAAVERGAQRLDQNPMNAVDAVLVFDGRISWGGQKLDAVIVHLRAYFSPDSQATIAVPYTPAASGRFRVHKPKLLAWDHCEDFDQQAAMESFLSGVARHEKAAPIWNNALDETK